MSTTRENHVDEHGNLIKVDEQKNIWSSQSVLLMKMEIG